MRARLRYVYDVRGIIGGPASCAGSMRGLNGWDARCQRAVLGAVGAETALTGVLALARAVPASCTRAPAGARGRGRGHVEGRVRFPIWIPPPPPEPKTRESGSRRAGELIDMG